MAIKLALQIAGLGVGFIPESMARQVIHAQQLQVKEVAEPRQKDTLNILCGEQGRKGRQGLTWWLNRLDRVELSEKLWMASQ